jgi:hypothetical protein
MLCRGNGDQHQQEDVAEGGDEFAQDERLGRQQCRPQQVERLPLALPADGPGGESRADEGHQKDLDGQYRSEESLAGGARSGDAGAAGVGVIGQIDDGDDAAQDEQVERQDGEGASPTHSPAQLLDRHRVAEQTADDRRPTAGALGRTAVY